jgi:hypothetical protein
MIGVLCEVSPGLRDSERGVAIPNVHGRKERLRIEANYLREREGRTYLPVGFIYEHEPSNSVLIELPLEADSGHWRMFVPKENVLDLGDPPR